MIHTFERSPLDLLLENFEQVELDVRTYAATFTGSRFEAIARRNPDPDTITADDLVAVSMLDVHVSGAAAIWLLEEGGAKVSKLLKCIPSDQDLWEVDPAIVGPRSAAWELWDLLRGIRWKQSLGKLGPTTCSKLMAAKRPRLLPVHDGRVQAALYPNGGHDFDFWAAWHDELTSRPDIRDDVCDRLRGAAGDMPASALRLLDIAVWSRARQLGLGGPELVSGE